MYKLEKVKLGKSVRDVCMHFKYPTVLYIKKKELEKKFSINGSSGRDDEMCIKI